MLPLAINWPLSSHTGYGIYGLQILLHYLRRGGTGFVLTDYPILPLTLPPGTNPQILTAIRQAEKAATLLEENPQGVMRFDHPVLEGVGNCYAAFKNQFRVRGKPTVGCAAIEHLVCPPDWLPYMKIYDLFISISRWNDAYLKSLNLAPVKLCRLGADTNIFRPGPRADLWRDRFVIFSGGKFEYRKGQDIVLAAFKRFREKHPEALLVAAWQNQRSVSVEPFMRAGHCTTVPAEGPNDSILLDDWLKSQGLPQESFAALPWMPNQAMAEILRVCDIAVFPNRCEGGTNMVAMETIASGVPTYVAANTGQQDLIDLLGCGAFRRQTPLAPVPNIPSVEGWCETDVEEVVNAFERVYSDPAGARADALEAATRMKAWDWAEQNEKLLQAIYSDLPA